MNRNIGNEIKVLATFIFWGIALIGAISALILGNTINFFIGFLVFVASIISAWLSTLFIYGYGELIENSSDINAKLDKLLQQNPSSNQQNSSFNQQSPSSNQQNSASIQSVFSDKQNSVATKNYNYGNNIPVSKSKWFCRECGTQNISNDDYCVRCLASKSKK